MKLHLILLFILPSFILLSKNDNLQFPKSKISIVKNDSIVKEYIDRRNRNSNLVLHESGMCFMKTRSKKHKSPFLNVKKKKRKKRRVIRHYDNFRSTIKRKELYYPMRIREGVWHTINDTLIIDWLASYALSDTTAIDYYQFELEESYDELNDSLVIEIEDEYNKPLKKFAVNTSNLNPYRGNKFHKTPKSTYTFKSKSLTYINVYQEPAKQKFIPLKTKNENSNHFKIIAKKISDIEELRKISQTKTHYLIKDDKIFSPIYYPSMHCGPTEKPRKLKEFHSDHWLEVYQNEAILIQGLSDSSRTFQHSCAKKIRHLLARGQNVIMPENIVEHTKEYWEMIVADIPLNCDSKTLSKELELEDKPVSVIFAGRRGSLTYRLDNTFLLTVYLRVSNDTGPYKLTKFELTEEPRIVPSASIDSTYTGIRRTYRINGIMESEIAYKKGILSGGSHYYHPNGKLSNWKLYKDGILIKKQIYNEEGIISRKIIINEKGENLVIKYNSKGRQILKNIEKSSVAGKRPVKRKEKKKRYY